MENTLENLKELIKSNEHDYKSKTYINGAFVSKLNNFIQIQSGSDGKLVKEPGDPGLQYTIKYDKELSRSVVEFEIENATSKFKNNTSEAFYAPVLEIIISYELNKILIKDHNEVVHSRVYNNTDIADIKEQIKNCKTVVLGRNIYGQDEILTISNKGFISPMKLSNRIVTTNIELHIEIIFQNDTKHSQVVYNLDKTEYYAREVMNKNKNSKVTITEKYRKPLNFS